MPSCGSNCPPPTAAVSGAGRKASSHRVLILLVCPGLPDVPVVGRVPLILGCAPLLPEYSLSLILLPVQVGPVGQAGSTYHLPKGRRGWWEAASRLHGWEHPWAPLVVPPPTHPRLPALDVLLLKDDLCLSCDFMITSCLCFSSNSRTLNSSSSHRSESMEESMAGRGGGCRKGAGDPRGPSRPEEQPSQPTENSKHLLCCGWRGKSSASLISWATTHSLEECKQKKPQVLCTVPIPSCD